MNELEDLAHYGANLIVWGIITLLLYIFTSGWIWLVVKFIMTVMLIYGVRDWFVDWNLFLSEYKADELKK